ncbi:TPA: hypothetical protein ACWX32_001389, partial [Acinetobacter baumannii]
SMNHTTNISTKKDNQKLLEALIKKSCLFSSEINVIIATKIPNTVNKPLASIFIIFLINE